MRSFLRAIPWGFVLHCALPVLPALAFAWFSVRFWLCEVPRIVARERAEVTRQYRRTAEELARDRSRANWEGEPSKERNLKLDARTRWGWQPFGTGALVWVAPAPKRSAAAKRDAAPAKAVGLRVAAVETTDYAILFGIGIPLVNALFLFVTGLGVWYFVRFARERNDFVAATAHDLTTPLAGLRLVIGRDDAEAALLADRLSRIVKNLKAFLGLGGRRPPPARDCVDLLAAYDEAYRLYAEEFRDLFGGEDVAVDVRGLGDGDACVAADETLCVQVLWNLLGNDFKYAAPYGRVTARFRRTSDRVLLELADAGPGLAPRELRRLFRRYYRAPSALTSGRGGFGVGLCTARAFARAMGGDVTVRANVPRGCVFTLSLPAWKE